MCIAASPGSAAAYRTLADVEGSARPIVWRTTPAVGVVDYGSNSLLAALLRAELEPATAVWAGVDCADHPIRVSRAGDEASIRVRIVTDWQARGYADDVPGTTELALLETADGVEIAGAEILLDGTRAWRAHDDPDPSAFDLRAVLVHELGHAAVGLAHICEPSVGHACDDSHADATLYPYYTGSGQARLAAEDIRGICDLYPTGAVAAADGPVESCGEDAHCGGGHWCVDGQCQADPLFGSSCTTRDECLGRVCVADPVTRTPGVCSHHCLSDSDCPADTRCAAVRTSSDLRVCAPRPMSADGCSVAPAGQTERVSQGLCVLLFGVLLLLSRRRRPPLMLALLLFGCGAESTTLESDASADDAGLPLDANAARDAQAIDARAPDALAPAMDAGTPDAGEPREAGTADASRTDASVDAGPPPPVCDPGATRLAPCERCGTQSESCNTLGQWEAASECIGQLECDAGTVENDALPRCAGRQRICLSTCEWTDWVETSSAGVCDAGATRLLESPCAPGQVRQETCDPSCSGWTETRACGDICGGAARTDPEYAREVCVGAGNFIRGSERFSNAQPVAEVRMSAFYIDRYPVTERRYKQCPSHICARPYTMLAAFEEYPVQYVAREAAIAFCDWDGGRRLPTEAEWEMAARGPAPRVNRFPYDGDEERCDLLYTRECGWDVGGHPSRSGAYPYDGIPGSRSYYGTYLQFGGPFEMVHDYYRADYYADPSSLSDPVGPAFGDFHVHRGTPINRAGPDRSIAMRNIGPDSGSFRCARSAR